LADYWYVRRVRGSAAVLFLSGVALAFLAVACVSSSIHATHRVPFAFMYLWFAALSFFAAWASHTQPRITD